MEMNEITYLVYDAAGEYLVTCPVCGRECWETPEKVVAMQLEPKLLAACTECALAAVLTRKEVLGHG